MVNEWVYCNRLAFLEWVDGEWADSGDTEEGIAFMSGSTLAAVGFRPPRKPATSLTLPPGQ